jgi:hypothetical protein
VTVWRDDGGGGGTPSSAALFGGMHALLVDDGETERGVEGGSKNMEK